MGLGSRTSVCGVQSRARPLRLWGCILEPRGALANLLANSPSQSSRQWGESARGRRGERGAVLDAIMPVGLEVASARLRTMVHLPRLSLVQSVPLLTFLPILLRARKKRWTRSGRDPILVTLQPLQVTWWGSRSRGGGMLTRDLCQLLNLESQHLLHPFRIRTEICAPLSSV
jgi:hypothetical protein